MDIDHLMPKFSPRVRAALAITSFIGDVIVEADNHRRETSVPPPDPADDFDDFEAALERFVSPPLPSIPMTRAVAAFFTTEP